MATWLAFGQPTLNFKKMRMLESSRIHFYIHSLVFLVFFLIVDKSFVLPNILYYYSNKLGCAGKRILIFCRYNFGIFYLDF